LFIKSHISKDDNDFVIVNVRVIRPFIGVLYNSYSHFGGLNPNGSVNEGGNFSHTRGTILDGPNPCITNLDIIEELLLTVL
jgi:hypothetical protein